MRKGFRGIFCVSVSDMVVGVRGIYLFIFNGLYYIGNFLLNVYFLRIDVCILVIFIFSRVVEWVKSICEW